MLCVNVGCPSAAIFGSPGSPYALRCALHKKSKDIEHNVMCAEPGCPVYPVYGDGQARCCNFHRTPNMTNVDAIVCAYCDAYARYNTPNHDFGVVCERHMTPDMVDVTRSERQCQECERNAFYYADNINGIFCGTHRPFNALVTMRATCYEPGCQTTPTYASHGSTKRMYCSRHK